ncbi:interleukin-23 receptor [Clinocottus analis]|uniref:interleukin-23 receptor n=1 Tax=Clinocottus analis TaxID=304258 RepID=UPI0035C09CA9
MNLSSTLWRFIVILLSFTVKRGPLLPAAAGQRFNGSGHLTVEPPPPFLIGSNLTVYCRIPSLQQSFPISLELNGATVTAGKKVNSTTVKFSLFNVRKPRSIVRCKRMYEQVAEIVAGLDLRGGLPPDKPGNVLCEMSRSSDFINCTWERGRETHLNTTYGVSLSRENGTQMLFDQIQDAGDVAIPRARVDENTTHRLIITAHNHFGASRSDPFTLRVKEIMIPETPRITRVEFGNNNSNAAALRWETSGSSEGLRSHVRLREDGGSWAAREAAEPAEGLIQVDGLRPLTAYEFQMRTCDSRAGAAGSNAGESRWFCSRWSPSVAGRSPGKGPSQQMHVWRMLGGVGTAGLQTVTVLWKPPSPDDYSGALQSYRIFLGDGQKQEVTCAAALSRRSLQVPAGLRALSISAVALYGTSPPAHLPLGPSGGFGPVLREPAPSANGVFVSWSWPEVGNPSTSGGEPLHFVLEWTSVPAAELQWQKVDEDQNGTFITGLTAGVRYNVSLYAVTTRGVSAPSSLLLYSKELKPASGPRMSVLTVESRRILIQWDELPVVERRGFIANYTVYLQALDSSKAKHTVTVPGSAPRRMWLDCPEGALALQMTASTSAGEGKRGGRVCFQQHESTAVGLVIVMVFIVLIFIAIVANLMCWSCVRERIKHQCVSWGPAWLHENLPKPGNSNAIRLLKEHGGEPFLSSAHSDPPLSLVSPVSRDERDLAYPAVHVEPLLTSDPGTPPPVDWLLDRVSYKPQVAAPAPRVEERKEAEDEQAEEDRCVFGGLLGGFLTGAVVDLSDPALGLTFGSVGGLLWPKAPETSIFLNGDFLLGRTGTENEVEEDPPSLESQQGEIMTPESEDTCLSQYTVEMLTGGYFPQAAAVTRTPCDTQR